MDDEFSSLFHQDTEMNHISNVIDQISQEINKCD